MEDLITIAISHPKIASILMLIGAARAVFKPLMLAVENLVEATPSKKDDEKLKKIKESKAYKGAALALDYVASIKLPK